MIFMAGGLSSIIYCLKIEVEILKSMTSIVLVVFKLQDLNFRKISISSKTKHANPLQTHIN